MRKLHNPQLRICLLLMLCVLTGGCSPIGEEQSSQTSEPQENSHESVTDLSSAPEESGTEPIPMAGGELSLTVQNPQTLNPLLTDDEDTAQMLNLIFSPLLDINQQDEVCPSIGSSWEWSEDNRTVTITINTDILWQDGKSVTAQDAAYSIQVLQQAPETVYYKSCVQYIESVRTSGNDQLIVTFTNASRLNLKRLYFPVISQSYYTGSVGEGLDNAFAPMGSGPYKMESYQALRELRLVSNDTYFKQVPFITNISVYLSRDETAKLEAFNQKKTTLFHTEFLNWGNYINQKSLSMYSIDSHYVQVLAFNMKKPLLEEARVRKGIAISLNTAKILKNVWLNKGTLAEAPIYPNGWYSPTNQANYTYDAERAGEYLQNAIDSQLTILVNTSVPDQEAIGEEIADALQRIGFVVALDRKEETAYSQALQEGNFDLALCRFRVLDEMDIAEILGSKGSQNYTGYASRDMDAALEAIGTQTEEETIHQAFVNLAQQVVEDLPYFTLFFQRQATLTGLNVRGDLEPTSYNVYRGIENLFIAQQ